MKSIASILFLASFAVILPAQTGSFDYPDFSSTTHLQLQGDAEVTGNLLRMSKDNQSYTKSAAWDDRIQNVSGGFTTEFDFSFSRTDGSDGLSFYCQSEGIPSTGNEHTPLESFGVFFDTYTNSWNSSDHDLEVNWTTGGAVTNRVRAVCSVDFADTLVHHAKIEYSNGEVKVFVDDMMTPELTVALDLENSIQLQPGGQAWLGFHSPGGGAPQNSDVHSWSFLSHTEPFVLVVPTLQTGSLAQFEMTGARAKARVHLCYSLTGLGVTSTIHGFDMGLAQPIVKPLIVLANHAGNATGYLMVPAAAPAGLPIWWQAVSAKTGDYLLSDPVAATIQ
ncbi:MAG: hypothetical protein QGH51_02000 [Planctomycetota bacterium]|jgi:hypothetical protein|nr:hypothetical protein [Planctomycetota bacterium]MDP6940774.1 hypothetical protein [Planctomycetota bacterium]